MATKRAKLESKLSVNRDNGCCIIQLSLREGCEHKRRPTNVAYATLVGLRLIVDEISDFAAALELVLQVRSAESSRARKVKGGASTEMASASALRVVPWFEL